MNNRIILDETLGSGSIQIRRVVIVLLFGFIGKDSYVFSFSPRHHVASHHQTRLNEHRENSRDDLFHGDERLTELELARASLDDMVFRSCNSPILTTASRQRRRVEIQLLEQLSDDPETAEALVHLWMTECGPQHGHALMTMADECSSGLVREETLLRDMMEVQPTWVEPKARLATLLFYKGRTEESRALAEKAVQEKPWHFEVYPLLVMICLHEQDLPQAIGWARQGLPVPRPSSEANLRRRRAWTKWAIAEATKQLEQAEKATLKARFNDLFVVDAAWE